MIENKEHIFVIVYDTACKNKGCVEVVLLKQILLASENDPSIASMLTMRGVLFNLQFFMPTLALI